MKIRDSRKAICLAFVACMIAGSSFLYLHLPKARDGTPAVPNLNEIPMVFEPNRGQEEPSTKFVARGPGYRVTVVSADEMALSLRDTEAVVRMRLIGANSAALMGGEDELPGKTNYFLGSDPSKWQVNVPTYGSVRAENVYDGIDLQYHANGPNLESDFIVAAGSDPAIIRFFLSDNCNPALDDNGHLVLSIPGKEGDLRFHRPVAYQTVNGRRVEIPVAYELAGHEVGLSIGMYSRRDSLVIDPVLTYSTFLGGGSDERATGIALDGARNIYVAGFTQSSNFPRVLPLQMNSGGGRDVFVTKLDPTGTTVLYSTYFGGSQEDYAWGLAVAASGNAYIIGSTNSDNLPLSNPLQGMLRGSPDAFVAKLDPSGSALAYSTYLGGDGFDEGNKVAVDANGNAYLTGVTYSTNFPRTAAMQPNLNGTSDAFVTKLDASGTLVYSTYFGGNSDDAGYAIVVDDSGNAYLTGSTSSSNFPTVNALQSMTGGGSDAFITKFNATGSAAIYSTYLGGGSCGSGEIGFAIVVDSSQNAYVAGQTCSTNFPTANPVQEHLGGFIDGFITKINAAGSSLLFSTFVGGESFDRVNGIAVDSVNNVHVAGSTNSGNFPLVASLAGKGNPSSGDAFVLELTAAGSSLAFSTTIGDKNDPDDGNSIAVDAEGNVFVAGFASPQFPTVNPVQVMSGGGGDAFIIKISPKSRRGQITSQD